MESLGELLGEVKQKHPSLRLNVHVDDITVALAAPATAQVVAPLQDMMRRAQVVVEHEMQGSSPQASLGYSQARQA